MPLFSRQLLALAAVPGPPRKLRWLLLRAAGVQTAAWNIAPGCFFSGHDLTIGRGTYINRGCGFDTYAPVRIGERCAIGMRALFITSTHHPGGPECRAGPLTGAPVTIGDGCWIGSQAVLLPGVTVGDGCIIASGSVVRADCEPHTMYAGVPARAIRPLDR
jgi:maltose O-acetyltransferase